MMFYFGAQIAGAGKTLFTVFGIHTTIGMIVSITIVILLSYAGGFVSVAWTDMIQSLMMLATLSSFQLLHFIIFILATFQSAMH